MLHTLVRRLIAMIIVGILISLLGDQTIAQTISERGLIYIGDPAQINGGQQTLRAVAIREGNFTRFVAENSGERNGGRYVWSTGPDCPLQWAMEGGYISLPPTSTPNCTYQVQILWDNQVGATAMVQLTSDLPALPPSNNPGPRGIYRLIQIGSQAHLMSDQDFNFIIMSAHCGTEYRVQTWSGSPTRDLIFESLSNVNKICTVYARIYWEENGPASNHKFEDQVFGQFDLTTTSPTTYRLFIPAIVADYCPWWCKSPTSGPELIEAR